VLCRVALRRGFDPAGDINVAIATVCRFPATGSSSLTTLKEREDSGVGGSIDVSETSRVIKKLDTVALGFRRRWLVRSAAQFFPRNLIYG